MTRLRVALTGGIASGKTAVSDRLRELGAVVIDADLLAREVVAVGSSGLAAVVQRFGPGVLEEGGRLNRAALGSIVFADPDAREDLEAIIHPAVRRRAAEIEARAAEEAVVVHVIPLLVETGQAEHFDRCVVVDVDPGLQRERLLLRDGFGPAEADRRIAAQADREQRLAVADLVIDNSGSRSDLLHQVDRVWAQLRSGGPRS